MCNNGIHGKKNTIVSAFLFSLTLNMCMLEFFVIFLNTFLEACFYNNKMPQ